MGKLLDYIKNQDTKHNYCGYRICGNFFIVFCADIIGYNRGEGSGARYPEYEERDLLSISLEPLLEERGNDVISIGQLLSSLEKSHSWSWGEWYVPPQTARIMRILDSIPNLTLE